MRFSFSFLGLIAIACMVFFASAVSRVSAQDLDPAEVMRAIEQGVAFLKRAQNADGSWSEYSTVERCGSTALCLLALTSCGISKEDATIRRGMQYLRQFPGELSGRNYSLSLQTMAFCLVDPDRDRALIRQNVELLERNQAKQENAHSGGWNYSPGGGSDTSNSQFPVLALYEAQRVGIGCRKETWQRANQYWFRTQNRDGGWGYSVLDREGSREVRGSMTCAGIASLMVTSGILGTSGASVRGNVILCSQPVNQAAADRIALGLQWMEKNFSVSQNPGAGMWLYYYLYALERVGRMSNHRFIGNHDWYREGADKILALRDRLNGSWTGQGTGSDVSTAFALLFLSKGRRPVLMSKIGHSSNDSWNVHPNDVNNLTLFSESRWNMELTWQSITIDKAQAEDLFQSPVLYMCGSRSPLPANDKATLELVAKLRAYIDQGGFLWAETLSNDKGFDAGFRTLMKAVFPEPGYELALLDSSHPIWSAEIPIDPDQIRPIEGINFGCRTSVVYVPHSTDPVTNRGVPSLSCLWEVADIFQRNSPYPADVQRQVDAGLGIGLNVLAYATNRELKFKDQIAQSVAKRASDVDQRRGRVFIGLLNHGETNAAPRAIPNLLQWAESNMGIEVETRSEPIDPVAENLFEYPILFMHGRSAFQFSPEAREKLRKHLESGGTLFANAICSRNDFSNSFRAEMEKIFPQAKLELIQTNDPLLTEEYGGFLLEKLEIKIPEQAPGRKMIAPTRSAVPELYGIRIEDRLAVIFSPNDVSCSLELAGTLECRGYTAESAMRLAVNVLLYALEHW